MVQNRVTQHLNTSFRPFHAAAERERRLISPMMFLVASKPWHEYTHYYYYYHVLQGWLDSCRVIVRIPTTDQPTTLQRK